jgi:hypothetical protein
MPNRISQAAQAVAAALLLMTAAAPAAEPARRIAIFVEPYYAAAREAGAAPRVAVGRSFDALLASSRREDIVAARDLIVARPATVTPMAMMVLAIRLYDVGLRDDAVFWFYVAKDRYILLSDVAEPNAPQLAQADAAIRSFATLAGPFINGYAFCALANQQAIRRKALDWVEANPYEVMFMQALPARGPDRKALLERALAEVKSGAAKERAYFDDAKVKEDYYARRKRSGAEERFCWK